MTPSPTNATFAIISSVLLHAGKPDFSPDHAQKSMFQALLMARPVAARQRGWTPGAPGLCRDQIFR
jgi:hypothetical protein